MNIILTSLEQQFFCKLVCKETQNKEIHIHKSGDYASNCSTPPTTEFIFELVFQEGYYCFKFGPAGLFVYSLC